MIVCVCVCSTDSNPGTPRIVWGYMSVPYFLAHNRRGQMFPRPRPSVMAQTHTFQAGFVAVLPCSLLGVNSPQASVGACPPSVLGPDVSSENRVAELSACLNCYVLLTLC